jgi:sugar phosphate permease
MIPAIAGDRVPKKLRGRALGLINTAGDLGAMIGPFAALGILNSGWLTLSRIYQIGGVLFVLVALLAFSPLVSRRSSEL